MSKTVSEWFSARGDLAPMGHLAMTEDIFVVTTGAERALGI